MFLGSSFEKINSRHAACKNQRAAGMRQVEVGDTCAVHLHLFIHEIQKNLQKQAQWRVQDTPEN